jgi:hypothetical protein
MLQKLRLLTAILGLLAVASFPAEPADDMKPPSGYRKWFHVNTMIVDKGSPLFTDLGGMHNVYVNSAGEAALKKGGPYPNKTMFVCTNSRSPTAPTWKAPERRWPSW